MAAGKGERLKGLTQTIPKALVEVAGKTLLEYAINRLTEANILNITIAVGWKSDMIRHAITQFENSPVMQIVDVSDYEIGPLQTLTTALDAIQDEESIICPVDLLVSSNAISEIISRHAKSQDTLVTLAIDPQSTSGSIVSLDSHGHVIGVQKEVGGADSVAKSAMFMVVSSGFAEYCRKSLSNGSTTAVSVLNNITKTDYLVQSFTVSERWFDVDTIANVLEANRNLLESGEVHYHKSIFVPSGDVVAIGDELSLSSDIKVGNGVTLKGPCLIQRGSMIGANCVIGPYTSLGISTRIGDNCEIQNAVISGQSRIPNHSKVNDILVNQSEIFRMEE